MKKLTSIIILSFMMSSFNPLVEYKDEVESIETVISPLQPPKSTPNTNLVKPKNLFLFLEDMGFSESSNRYHIKNKFGYLGKYQFGIGTLRGLGYKISSKQFLKNPQIQEEAMIKLLRHNQEALKKYITKYQNKIVNGIFITESGILAAAHLSGTRNVKRWFKGRQFKDGLGTSLSSYMSKFSNYDLKFL